MREGEHIEAVAAALGVTPADVERRKEYIGFGEREARSLMAADAGLRGLREELPARFCAHLRRFDETWRLIREADAESGVQRAQARYVAGLTAGRYDWDRAREQLAAGLRHAELGLAPRWFVGAYAVYVDAVLAALQRFADRGAALDTAAALAKLVLLDIGLGVEAYEYANRERLRRVEQAAREAEALAQQVLDALSERVAVIGADGAVLAVNRAWDHAARREGGPLLTGAHPGVDYFALCRLERFVGGQPVAPFVEGMRAVAGRELDGFDWLYTAVGDAAGSRVYLARVRPLAGGGSGRIVVSHLDLTQQREAERAAAEERDRLAEAERRERERQHLRRIVEPAHTAETARTFGLRPLRETAPALFAAAVGAFGEVLDRAIEQRAYKIAVDLTEPLRAIAAQLGARRVGPRDVIEVYLAALEERQRGVAPAKARAYAEEGQVLALELMGYLVSQYRTEAAGLGRPAPIARGVAGGGKRDDG